MSVVFITGATKNTGYAIAEKFASCGYDVAVSSRRKFDADKAALGISTKYQVKAALLHIIETEQLDPSVGAIEWEGR